MFAQAQNKKGDGIVKQMSVINSYLLLSEKPCVLNLFSISTCYPSHAGCDTRSP